MPRFLTQTEAQRFYDGFGSKQDAQAFYEDRALSDLVAHAALAAATTVCELGCGTGRLAERLLSQELSPDVRYTGVDLSSTMAGLAQQRLARFGSRVAVWQGDLAVLRDHAPSADRVISTYVLDLLPDSDIEEFLRTAHDILVPDGLLCLAGLTFGETFISRLVSGGWQMLAAVSPRLVGGCRPIRATDHLPEGSWDLVHRAVVSSYGISSEVLVAAKRMA